MTPRAAECQPHGMARSGGASIRGALEADLGGSPCFSRATLEEVGGAESVGIYDDGPCKQLQSPPKSVQRGHCYDYSRYISYLTQASDEERKIATTSFLDASFMKTLASAIRFGTPLLVQVLAPACGIHLATLFCFISLNFGL